MYMNTVISYTQLYRLTTWFENSNIDKEDKPIQFQYNQKKETIEKSNQGAYWA